MHAAVEQPENRTLIDSYTLDQERRALARESIQRRLYTLHAFAAHLHPRSLLAADRHDVHGYLDGRHLGARTRSYHISNLSAFYTFCVEEGWLNLSPTARVRHPKVTRLLPRPIGDDDLRRALYHADPRMACWLTLAAYEGLRCKEIAAARREDILDSQRPPILIVANGKGGHQRVLPLNRHVQEALSRFRMPRRGPLWHGERGGPLHPNTVSRYVSRYLASLRIDATCHQLRHWFASRVYSETRDIRLVQSLLGHADISTTTVYTKVSNIDAEGTVRDLDVHAEA